MRAFAKRFHEMDFRLCRYGRPLGIGRLPRWLRNGILHSRDQKNANLSGFELDEQKFDARNDQAASRVETAATVKCLSNTFADNGLEK